MTNVVLHIGLHKAATRYLQRAVFANLDVERFLFNPEPLFHDLRQAMRHPGDPSWQERARNAARHVVEGAGDRTIVISDPSIAGDMYSSYSDWCQNRDLVHELFPEARIIYFVRRQSDWLHSAYRQAMAKGPGMPIEFFLNFRDGGFHRRAARMIGGARNLNALELPFLEIYRGYCDCFGAEQVYLFRQEDLRARADDVYARLVEALGVETLPDLPVRVSGNRAMSALAIHLFCPGVYLGRRSAEEGAPADTTLNRLRVRLRRWRTILVQHVFDRIVYRDWDLLARHGMRDRLESHYQQEHETLGRIAQVVLDEGPGYRARSLAHR